MSVSPLDPFYHNALSILRNAKSPDGGLLSYMLSYVTQSNLLTQLYQSRLHGANSTSSVTVDVPHLVATQIQSTLLHYGFFWAIFFGLLWMLVLLLSGICLCVLHFRRKQSSKTMMTYKMVAKVLQKKRMRMDSNRICVLIQGVLCLAMILFLLALFSLATKTVTDIRNSLSESSRSGNQNAILPRTASALHHLANYLQEFARNAANQSAPIVEEMVAETERQQNHSSHVFNAALQARLGGARSMLLGDQMTHFLLTMTDNCQPLTSVNTKMFNEWQNLSTTISSWQRSIRHLQSHFNGSDLRWPLVKRFLKWSVATNTLSVPLDFASSFVYFMAKENRTREKIVQDSMYAKIKMKEKMARMKDRMDAELNVANLLRLTIGETWTKMDKKLQNLSRSLHSVAETLDSKVHGKLNGYAVLLVIVALFCLLVFVCIFSTASYIFYRYHWTRDKCVPHQLRNALKVWSYSLLMALCVPLGISMTLFLVTGYLEDDLCRYIRTSDLQRQLDHHETPLLDQKIKDFLHYNWPMIEKLAEDPRERNPLPRPNRFLAAIVDGCQKDAPILEALDAIKTMDTSALSKPEITNRIVAVGRRLMLEAMNETQPTEMLAPGTLENLEKADSLDKFLQTNLSVLVLSIENYRVISEGALELDNAQILSSLSKFASLLKSEESTLEATVLKLTQQMIEILQRIDRAQEVAKRQLTAIKDLPPVMPIVKELLVLVRSIIDKMGNKPALLRMADEIFTELVVKTTPKNSAELMAKFGPKLMAQIGRCRPLYLAYHDVTYALCSSTLSPLSGLWLFFGSMCLLCTTALTFLLSLLSKRDGNSCGASSTNSSTPRHQEVEHLRSVSNNNNQKKRMEECDASLLGPRADAEPTMDAQDYAMVPLRRPGTIPDERV